MAVDTDIDIKPAAPAAYVDRRLIGSSAVLLAGGFLVCLAGATVGAVALAGAGRRYVATWDETPRDIARRRWAQVKSATSAGYCAWTEYGRRAHADSTR
jgi:hypothetical protein